MGALIPLAISLAPEIGRWLFGAKGERTAQDVARVVQLATNTSDEAEAQKIVARDPELAAHLRMQLLQLAAGREQAVQLNELDEIAARLRDTADARAQTTALAQVRSLVQWAAPIVSLIVLSTFGAVMWLALTRSLPAGSETILNMLLGTLAAMANSVVCYWVGSSAGSKQKTEMLYRSAPGIDGAV